MHFFHRKPPRNESAQAYLDSFHSFKLKHCSPEQGPIVVLDTETSGFSIQKDRMLSAGLIWIEDAAIQIDQTRGWFLNQGDIPLKASTPVHGIIASDLEDGIHEAAFLEALLPYLHGCIVVGHHIRFDAKMLNEAMLRHFGIKWKNPLIDTAHIAMEEMTTFHRTGYASQPAPGLDEVCSQLNIYPMERHSAWGDAFTTAEVYLTLCARIRQRLGRALKISDLQTTRIR